MTKVKDQVAYAKAKYRPERTMEKEKGRKAGGNVHGTLSLQMKQY